MKEHKEAWERGEIILPTTEDIVFIDFSKYEKLSRDSEVLAGLMRYLTTEKPSLKGVRKMLDTE